MGVFRKNSWTLRRTIVLGLLLVPAALTFFFIRLYGVNVPYWDQWEIIALLSKWQAQGIAPYDLVTLANEHRIVFPKLWMLTLATLTNYNTLAEMYCNWLLVCASAGVVFSMYRKTFGLSDLTLIQFLPVMWLLFGLQQYENWLWGMQIVVFLPVFAALGTFALLEQSVTLDRYFLAAVASGGVAAFSFANGLFVWPIGLFQLWGKGRSREEPARTVDRRWLWGLVGISAFVLYFTGYAKNPHHPSLLYGLWHPWTAVLYFFAVLGHPLTDNLSTAVATGFLLICFGFFAYALKFTGEPWRVTFWDALVLFAVLSAGSLVLGRSGFGLEQALSSRYTTFTILGIIGLYCKLLIHATYRRVPAMLVYGALGALIIQGILLSIYTGVGNGKITRANRRMAAYVLQTLPFQSDARVEQMIYPVAAKARQLTLFLERQKLSVFATRNGIPDRRLPEAVSFAVDTVNDRLISQGVVIESAREAVVTVNGWALDAVAKQVASGVLLEVDGRLTIPAQYGLPRPDVASLLGWQYKFSGFSASFATSVLAKGLHTLSLRVISADGQGYYEPSYQTTVNVQ